MSGTTNARWIFQASDILPIIQGQIAPPIIAMTRSDDPSFVYGPRLFKRDAAAFKADLIIAPGVVHERIDALKMF